MTGVTVTLSMRVEMEDDRINCSSSRGGCLLGGSVHRRLFAYWINTREQCAHTASTSPSLMPMTISPIHGVPERSASNATSCYRCSHHS